MKKIIFTVAVVFSFGSANAQDVETKGLGFSKGDAFISGSMGINSEKEEDFKSTGFEIESKIGFFVTENIAIGSKLGFASYKE
jgi:outer membrane protein